jgi:hypothetical protein
MLLCERDDCGRCSGATRMNLGKAVRAVVDSFAEKLSDLSYMGYTRIEHEGFPQSTQLDDYS